MVCPASFNDIIAIRLNISQAAEYVQQTRTRSSRPLIDSFRLERGRCSHNQHVSLALFATGSVE